jgi:hypothetical protein
MKHPAFLFPLLLARFIAAQTVPTPLTLDSLRVQATGGVSIDFQEHAGRKSSEEGLIRVSLDHPFTDRLHAVIALRASRSSARPAFEEGSLAWRGGQGEVKAGFLSDRYGLSTLYRPHSVFQFLFDKPLLWDTYGFGAGGALRIGPFTTVSGSATMNTRESGEAHALATVTAGELQARLLGGFQAYSPEDQDNHVVGGGEFAAGAGALMVHCAAKFVRFTGFGVAANPTMTPGRVFDGYLETHWDPLPRITLNGILYYQNYAKRYRHEFLLGGAEGTWMFLTTLGIGARWEVQRDGDLLSSTPALSVVFVPVPNKTELRISAQQLKTEAGAPIRSVTAELWFQL